MLICCWAHTGSRMLGSLGEEQDSAKHNLVLDSTR